MNLKTPVIDVDLVVFDLDGTLVDTKVDIVTAFEWTLARHGAESVDRTSIEALVGTGVQGYLRECLTRKESLDVESALDEFKSYYRANVATHSRLFPHIIDLLEHCSHRHLAVLTNKPEAFAKPLLDKLGIAHYFGAIYTADSFERRKPDPLPLVRICERFSVPAERTLMVGDTSADILCGRNAGTKTCAVRHGYSTPSGIEECGPDWIVDSAKGLIDLLRLVPANLSQRLTKVVGKSSRRIIGLMSGMSMDGVDLACADISGTFPDLSVEILSSHYEPYPESLRGRLLASASAKCQDVSELNVLVAEAFACCVDRFFQTSSIKRSSIDAIGSHGQTLYHSTQNATVKSTLQVGSPSIISELTGILTVGNFRVRDLAAGGQGAPLVPLADYILFRDQYSCLALHNLGSLSNITVVTPRLEEIMSFDSGPANIAIDYFARHIPNNPQGMDLGGKLSQKGRCIPELLEQWMTLPFFSMQPPKAGGYEDFSVFKGALNKNYATEDLLRSAVEWTARTIEGAYRKFVFPKFPDLRKVKFSGGGVYNHTLMHRICELLPELKTEILEQTLSDSKEALAFAILANELLSGRAGSFPSTTGATGPTVLGEIAI